MTKKQEMLAHRKAQLLRSSNRLGSHSNCFRAYASETRSHITKKFLIWLELLKAGCKLYTEGIFLNGLRCDILAIMPDGRCKVIEILESETDEECDLKTSNYPKDIDDIIKVREVDENTIKDILC